MAREVDLHQLASGSRLVENRNFYDGMDIHVTVTDEEDQYETLGRHRNATGCLNSGDIPRTETTDTERNTTYTRYIRPCATFSNLCENNSSTIKSTVPVSTQTLEKRRAIKRKSRIRSVISGFVCGLVFGLILTSICWLTFDRLKLTRIVCEHSGKVDSNEGEAAESTTVQQNSTTDGEPSTVIGKGILSTLSSSFLSSKATVPTQLSERSTSVVSLLHSKLLHTTKGTKVSTVMSPTQQGVSNTPVTGLSSSSHTVSTGRENTVVSTEPLYTERTKTSTTSIMDTNKTLHQSVITSSRAHSSIIEITTSANVSEQTKSSYSKQPSFSSTLETQRAQQSSTISYTEHIDSFISTGSTTLLSTELLPEVLSSTTAIVTSLSISDENMAAGSTSPSFTASVSPENIDKRSIQGGHVYIRWGSLTCPTKADLLYTGYAAGGHWQHSGGATKTLCLPETPSWGNYSDGEDSDRNLVYGTEYGSSDTSFSSLTGKKLRNKDVPCSVCQAKGRLSHVMIPGMRECLSGWTLEYRGFLMGSGYIHSHASELICVDSSPDHVASSETVKGGHFLYFAEVRSGALPSASYPNGRELACVVCTL